MRARQASGSGTSMEREDLLGMPRRSASPALSRLPLRPLWRVGVAVAALSCLVLLAPHAAHAASGWPPPVQPTPNWNPGPPWAPVDPKGPEMHLISNLFWIVFALGMVVMAFVVAFLVINTVRYTARPDTPDPPQLFGNHRVEVAWTIIPTAVLVVAFAATVYAIHDINTPAKGATILNVNAIGHQWWWEFQYPTLGVVTAGEVHIPQGETIHFHVQSDDVIHSFWTPQLQRQVDANPGQDNAVYVKMDTPGVYSGMCYEYCGTDHAWMKYRLVVEPAAEFKAWVRQQQRPAKAHLTGVLAYGRTVFLNHSCVDCHAVNGTAAGGAVAPNLTHVGSRWAIGGGSAPNTILGLESWIYDPNQYKPGVLMPAFKTLSEKDIKALAAYLYSLK